MSAGRAAVQRAVLPLLSQFLKPVQLGSLLLHQLIMPTSGSLPRIGHLFHVLPGRWPRAPAGPRPAVQGAPHRSNSRNCRSPPNTWTFAQYIQTWTKARTGALPVQPHAATDAHRQRRPVSAPRHLINHRADSHLTLRSTEPHNVLKSGPAVLMNHAVERATTARSPAARRQAHPGSCQIRDHGVPLP